MNLLNHQEDKSATMLKLKSLGFLLFEAFKGVAIVAWFALLVGLCCLVFSYLASFIGVFGSVFLVLACFGFFFLTRQ